MARQEAEAIRKRLNSKGYVRKDVRIMELGKHVLLPLTDRVDQAVIEAEGLDIVDGYPRERECHRAPFDLIKEELALPDELADLLPHKWEMLGEVLIAKFPEPLRPHLKKIARTYAQQLGARTVLDERGYIDGTFRTPRMEIAYGSETVTVHHEGAILYKLDTAKLMFSSGNFDEKKRMGEARLHRRDRGGHVRRHRVLHPAAGEIGPGQAGDRLRDQSAGPFLP